MMCSSTTQAQAIPWEAEVSLVRTIQGQGSVALWSHHPSEQQWSEFTVNGHRLKKYMGVKALEREVQSVSMIHPKPKKAMKVKLWTQNKLTWEEVP
ncbi:unnamed protein product [Microthlaspi erraticum]|uniref:Uncharacterized protein n=1 Tax=Microthlaspi erraticum TaxID=1685480 RepID=A0A6D2HXB1_9BRAS|nr:unnamed protein product [Microthlaspi erraticum]